MVERGRLACRLVPLSAWRDRIGGILRVKGVWIGGRYDRTRQQSSVGVRRERQTKCSLNVSSERLKTEVDNQAANDMDQGKPIENQIPCESQKDQQHPNLCYTHRLRSINEFAFEW